MADRIAVRDRIARIGLPILIAIVVVSMMVIAVLTVDNHLQGQTNGRLLATQALVNSRHHTQTVQKDNQIIALQNQVVTIQKQYVAEQSALAVAGKIQEAFALWLIQSNQVIHECQSTPTCPNLPPVPNV